MQGVSRSLIVVCVLVLAVAAKPAKNGTISMASRDWVIGVASEQHPVQEGAGWAADFPLDYLMNTRPPSLTGKTLLALGYTITATGDPVFDYHTEPGNTCDFPSSVRLLLFRDWNFDDGRWWSNPLHVELAEGFATLSVPLTPDQWTSVNGLRADSSADFLSAFQDVVRRPVAIGMTFGGGCFFGHGVQILNGTGTFHALAFTAN